MKGAHLKLLLLACLQLIEEPCPLVQIGEASGSGDATIEEVVLHDATNVPSTAVGDLIVEVKADTSRRARGESRGVGGQGSRQVDLQDEKGPDKNTSTIRCSAPRRCHRLAKS